MEEIWRSFSDVCALVPLFEIRRKLVFAGISYHEARRNLETVAQKPREPVRFASHRFVGDGFQGNAR